MFVQWIVALVSIMEAEELQVHASPLVASLSRFMEDGPTASILKSSLKGNVFLSSKTNSRNPRYRRRRFEAHPKQVGNNGIP